MFTYTLRSQIASYIGLPHIYLDSVDSTNSYAMNLLSKGKPIEGTAISAGFQTSGRGQIGRTWRGEAGKNLYTSIILSPGHILAADQWKINQAISLAIAECLEALVNDPVSIKWPNDIYINDKKICGILIQCMLSGKSIHHAVIGIGLNINQQQFPIDLPNPTSMIVEKGESIGIIEMRKLLYAHIEKWYEKTKSSLIGALDEVYLSKLYKKDQPATFKKGDTLINGTIIGVDRIGRLQVLTNGMMETFNFNEIKMIINNQIL